MVLPGPANAPASRFGGKLLSRPGLSKKGNFLVVGLLVLIILLYFNWQVRHSTNIFFEHARQQSRMLAGVIRVNANNSLLSQGLLVKTVQRFLSNSAEFISYLNDIEPFSADELTAFASEAGLAGIRIVSVDQPGDTSPYVEGPIGWLQGYSLRDAPFQHLEDAHLFILTRPDPLYNSTMLVGFNAEYIEKLGQLSGLPLLLDSLENLPGIREVKIEPTGTGDRHESNEVEIQTYPELQLVAVHLFLGDKQLVVMLEASHYFDRISHLWREFFMFSGIIIVLGLFFSWLLSRFQDAHVREMQGIERQLAQQHEEATLGRAAATISHEIKNPLNAIGMGLQRLKLETNNMSPEHQGLVNSMLQAVNRTNHIVSDLKRHAQPISPRYKKIALSELVEAILVLYQQDTDDKKISINYNDEFDGKIDADEGLIGQVIENLIKNAIEAQPQGGYINVTVRRQNSSVAVTIENSGLTLEASDIADILEPYFTTKTQGAGLGLALSKRIVEAHQGRLALEVLEKGVLRVVVILQANHNQI